MGRTLNHDVFDATGNTFDNWDKLENVVDHINHLQITRFLLDAGSCMHLQDLHIFAPNCRDCFDDLLNTLHNAPVMKRFTLTLGDQTGDVLSFLPSFKSLTHLNFVDIDEKTIGGLTVYDLPVILSQITQLEI